MNVDDYDFPDDPNAPREPNPAGKRGRPPRLTPQIQEAIILLLHRGNYRRVACEAVGVSYSTFAKWLAAGRSMPDSVYGQFLAAVVVAEREAESEAVAWILTAGRGDPKHLQWYLERKHPQRWGKYRGELGEAKRRIAELEKQLNEILGTKTNETAGQADI
jgi:hypothetical protein